MANLLIVLVKVYRTIVSPLLGKCCRFHPSCSAYCIEAIEKHGCLRGMWLAAVRMCKCHPWHAGGVDRVPDVAGRWPDCSDSRSTVERLSAVGRELIIDRS